MLPEYRLEPVAEADKFLSRGLNASDGILGPCVRSVLKGALASGTAYKAVKLPVGCVLRAVGARVLKFPAGLTTGTGESAAPASFNLGVALVANSKTAQTLPTGIATYAVAEAADPKVAYVKNDNSVVVPVKADSADGTGAYITATPAAAIPEGVEVEIVAFVDPMQREGVVQ